MTEKIRKHLLHQVGDRLRKFREQFSLSQKEFAAKISTPASYISRYESGQYLPSDSVVKKMKKVFGLDDFWLATGITAERLRRERNIPAFELKRLFNDNVDIHMGSELLGLVLNPDGMPINVKLLVEKLKISQEEAEHCIAGLLKDGFIMGIGNGNYLSNPFFLKFGIKDSAFFENMFKLQRIYVEDDREKIAKIEGMLEMADPGEDIIVERLYKRGKKDGSVEG